MADVGNKFTNKYIFILLQPSILFGISPELTLQDMTPKSITSNSLTKSSEVWQSQIPEALNMKASP